MPRPKAVIPSYRLHKPSGQAVVFIDRRQVYLGKHGSPESRAAYSALLERIQSGQDAANVGRVTDKGQAHNPGVLLCELLLRFVTEELPKYAKAERRCIRGAIAVANQLFGDSFAADFGPLRLRTCREEMIRKGWSRSYVNKQTKRLRTIIKWAVGWEMVPQTLADSLAAVKSLEAGESGAPESKPRQAIPAEHLEAVRPFLTERYRDIFDLLLATGARSGEIIGLTSGTIDRSGDIWRANILKHKTRRHGKSRTLYFNAKAQLILTKYLKADPDAPLFRTRGDRFSASVKAACVKAEVPEFTPHALRHTVATRIVDELGTDVAQRLLGHSGAAMTRHYSTKAEKAAIDAVKRLG